jgi:hypothetical protein
MIFHAVDGQKGEEAVREYKRYETEIIPTHMIRVRKGDKNEPEREKVGEQEKGKTEYREMKPSRIEKRGDRPMSQPRHEHQNQKRLRTVISETIQCVDIGEVSLPDEKGAARSLPVSEMSETSSNGSSSPSSSSSSSSSGSKTIVVTKPDKKGTSLGLSE